MDNTIVISETKGHDALNCLHLQHTPVFSAAACIHLSPEQVRERYPRFDSICTVCKLKCTIYASLDHAMAGGWL